MKYKTTKKAVNNGYTNVICVPYCGLQTLLSSKHAVAYTVRKEGWATDVYDFGDTAIVTGYTPFGNFHPDYETCRRYEGRALVIREGYPLSAEERERRFDRLISEFIKEVING